MIRGEGGSAQNLSLSLSLSLCEGRQRRKDHYGKQVVGNIAGGHNPHRYDLNFIRQYNEHIFYAELDKSYLSAEKQKAMRL